MIDEHVKEGVNHIIKRYGIVGLILCYFLWMDYESRLLDREDRKNNVKIMEQLTERIADMDTRIKVLEITKDIPVSSEK